MRVLGIPGSLRRGSHNAALLRNAARMMPAGSRLVVWEELAAIPPFSQDDESGPGPAPVERLRAAVAGAEALLIATPEYNHSLPGQLKNALDWLSRPVAETPVRNKPAAVVGASTGMFGAVWAQAEARKVLKAIGARVLDSELPVGNAPDRFDAAGSLVDGELDARLRELVGELVSVAAPAPVAA